MPKNTLGVYFSNRVGAPGRAGFELPALILTPTSDKWNDFELRTRFRYLTVGWPRRGNVAGEIHLGFQGSDDSPRELALSAIRSSTSDFVAAGKLPGFYTMHFDMSAYRQVVQTLGVTEAREFLLAINDLVAIKRIGRPPPWFGAATTSRPFTLAFMRNSETFFAFYNAGSLLGGLGHESLGGMSKILQLDFQLSTFQNPHRIRFEFESAGDFPRRIVVLIGKNGVGKSQALVHFATSLLTGDRELLDADGKPPLISRLLAVSSPGETRNTFPTPPRSPRIAYQRVFVSRNSNENHHSTFGDALVRLVRSPETIRKKSRWQIFCESASIIAPLSELVLRCGNPRGASRQDAAASKGLLPLAKMLDGKEQERLERWGEVNFRTEVFRFINGEAIPLSSGQLTFIHFAAQVCLHIENGTMVLIDEPETHLHPNFVSDFIRLLDKLLADTGSFAVLATHSSYFVREVARAQVVVLRKSAEDRIETAIPRLKTLGADIGEISHFVFEDKYFGSLLEQVRARLKRDPARGASILASLEEDLAAEAWMNLKRELRADAR